jgi:hypothetical protein
VNSRCTRKSASACDPAGVVDTHWFGKTAERLPEIDDVVRRRLGVFLLGLRGKPNWDCQRGE